MMSAGGDWTVNEGGRIDGPEDDGAREDPRDRIGSNATEDMHFGSGKRYVPSALLPSHSSRSRPPRLRALCLTLSSSFAPRSSYPHLLPLRTHPPAPPSSPLQDGDEMSWDLTGSPDSTLWVHASVSRSQ